jgi:small subunit ribosomal protein S2
MLGELEKLEANLGGVADMRKQPDAVFIVDLRKEQLAVREARRLGLPVVALVDTNCDPDEADYVIPGNDDAIRSCSLIIRAIADGIAAGQTGVTAEEFARPSANGNGGAPAEEEEAAPEAAAEPSEPAASAEAEASVEPPAEPPAEEVEEATPTPEPEAAAEPADEPTEEEES